jgi:hypothetical protein
VRIGGATAVTRVVVGLTFHSMMPRLRYIHYCIY